MWRHVRLVFKRGTSAFGRAPGHPGVPGVGAARCAPVRVVGLLLPGLPVCSTTGGVGPLGLSTYNLAHGESRDAEQKTLCVMRYATVVTSCAVTNPS